MEQIELKAAKREVLGKKVRFLRRQGITPTHLFGHGIDSMALQCDAAELQQVLARAGKTRLVNLKIAKERKTRTIIIREVQAELRTGKSLHVDFYQVQMAEQVKMEVPIALIGEAPALKSKENMLAQELNTLSIECLPAEIPASIELDITSLTESDQALRVKDLELDEGISILNEPEQIVARISTRPVERIEEVEVEIVEGEEEEAVETPAKESKEEAREE